MFTFLVAIASHMIVKFHEMTYNDLLENAGMLRKFNFWQIFFGKWKFHWKLQNILVCMVWYNAYIVIAAVLHSQLEKLMKQISSDRFLLWIIKNSVLVTSL